ncbi:MAG TPA: hypothetical protein VKH37_01255, partial [Ferruginibacter sp.]|nr:hypothetical protein [Ferruginibacter sp.]
FFVQSSGGVPAITIQESHKTAGNNNGIFRSQLQPFESFAVSLYYTEGGGYRRLTDGVQVLYDNSYSASVDDDDADEINNWDENIAIARGNHHLSIESRPVIIAKDTIPIFMSGMHPMNYQFEFTAANFSNPALTATLVDSFTHTLTPLSVTGTTVVAFNVSADPASFATNRFMIIFGPLTPLAISEISITAYKKNSGVQIDWITKTEQDMDRYEVERSANGSQFNKINSTPSKGNNNSPTNYGWFDANPFNGMNFYRIKAISTSGETRYSAIVKVNINATPGTISISPNLISGNSFELNFQNMPKGNYDISLTNSIGQLIFKLVVAHAGGSSLQMVDLKRNLAAGVYDVLVVGTDVKKTIRIIRN